jgi:DNA (cytosine-5)-methyltransferase 1
VKPRLLDLFCGAGGAAMGYHRAGFDVVGVDHRPQPNYPFTFIHADALAAVDEEFWVLGGMSYFDAIHASPPCQAFTQMSARWRGAGGKADSHADLLTPTLELLRGMEIPWVVENVPGAKSMMRTTLSLHGGMFGLGVHRPRLFESNTLLLAGPAAQTVEPLGVYGNKPDGRTLYRYRNAGNYIAGQPGSASKSPMRAPRTLEEASEAMGIDWMTWDELREAIPPAYTELIGAQLLAHLKVAA